MGRAQPIERRRCIGAWLPAAAALCIVAFAAGARVHAAGGDTALQTLTELRARPPEDEIIYFLLPDRFANGDPGNDRGGYSGDRLHTGFDPADAAFYHGGDLRGVLRRLDYIQALGASALWLAPVFKNKPVQGAAGRESAGYHGYWITDFTRVDPHFGTASDLAALVSAAHSRGLKIYLDIVVNHTADVIAYRECPAGGCAYRSRADYPYQRRGGPDGAPINPGFAGDAAPGQTPANFALLTRADYAYTPFVPAGEEQVKSPGWLNDPIHYHNRGNSTFAGESSTFGDFAGLDDLMTEDPRVVQGFIDIYGGWIDRFGIDGYRIDTAKHVNPEFWQAFVPAILARARAAGMPNFAVFGEVSEDAPDPGLLAAHTRVDGLPAVLDFAFALAVRAATFGTAGTDALADVFAGDSLYEGGAAAALHLTTFVSNHDQGRYGWLLRRARPGIGAAESLQREQLAHAMLLTLRGVPALYYGDEQGFAGTGDNDAARQDMFESRVAAFNAEHLVGGGRGTDATKFKTDHPLFRTIQTLARLRSRQPALRRGRQVVRRAAPIPGVFAVSRFDPDTGRELLIAFNTSTERIDTRVVVEAASERFDALAGDCRPAVDAPGSYRVVLDPLAYAVCAARPAER